MSQPTVHIFVDAGPRTRGLNALICREQTAEWLPGYVLEMPLFLKSDQFTISIDDGTPSIALHDATVSSTEGWSFLNRATLLVADGPGEDGSCCLR